MVSSFAGQYGSRSRFGPSRGDLANAPLAGGLVHGPTGAGVPGRSRRDRTEDTAPADGSSARRILDERYAAGELSTQEYEHRRAALAGREEES
ncbi:SHOCT domain-containing protein [Serinicoccus chungangensis]|uniref:SHOCT domain-containing protein n=1 Tax=Serinicoccus chungangensis TaxID=767452 RepID=UPI00128F67B1|nr:SHOCT domain-containing protein [Serinicoccus chungangensis]